MLDAVGFKLVPVMLTTMPIAPLVGLNPVMTGTPGVRVIVAVAEVRSGALAVNVTGPTPVPTTVTGVSLVPWPAGIRIEVGFTVAIPLPAIAKLTVSPPAGAGAVEETVKSRFCPIWMVALAGVSVRAGGVWTVRSVPPTMGPEGTEVVAVIVVVPGAGVEATPLAVIVATAVFEEAQMTCDEKS